MEQKYELQLSKYTPVKGQKCKVLEITDLSLHTQHHRSTSSVGKKVKEAFRKDRPGRVFSEVSKSSPADMSAFMEAIQKDPEFMKMVREEQGKGYKVLLQIPKDGVLIKLGKDTEQFLESKNGKRILRGLEKNNMSKNK